AGVGGVVGGVRAGQRRVFNGGSAGGGGAAEAGFIDDADAERLGAEDVVRIGVGALNGEAARGGDNGAGGRRAIAPGDGGGEIADRRRRIGVGEGRVGEARRGALGDGQAGGGPTRQPRVLSCWRGRVWGAA